MRFLSWQEVLLFARAGAVLYYHAPLDYARNRLTPGKHPYGYVVRARTLRIYPPWSIGRGRHRTADPFTADKHHLSRFSHEGSAAGGIHASRHRRHRSHRRGRR
jgi:hypothetical protein